MKSVGQTQRRALLLAATSLAAFASPAQAQIYSIPENWVPEAVLDIIANHEVPLGPQGVLPGANHLSTVYSNSPQILDTAGSINGIGQQIAFNQATATTATIGLCTGTLINPRTVITAAHCVYGRPADQYGSNTGSGGGVNGPFGAGGAVVTSVGAPISFGFESLNRNCLNGAGLPAACPAGQFGPYEQWRNAGFQTIEARHIYNGNQVWYGTGAQPVALGGGGEFANQDIAIVTLDTHARGIPTWTMLFSPLDGPTHTTITGYGTAGAGISGMGNLGGIDYRRRSAENMIDGLFSTNDFNRSTAISGPGDTTYATHLHSIYWMDFDDPDYDPENLPANFAFQNPAPALPLRNQYWDFNGLGGVTLPNEGTTGGGDSGGPLIVDQRWDRSVIAGVLTGTFSFNGGIGLYGGFHVYPPLFQFWEDIVQNNPYKYASALAGNGDWFDPAHWVQDMDPNYVTIDANGDLVNLLPDTAQGGADGAVDKFGSVCFLGESCTAFDGPGAPAGDGTPHYTAGGPGSLNFVPNNVEPVNSATPGATIKARYYDVSLRRNGSTTLSGAATIDKMTIEGSAKFRLAATGTLHTWADYTQVSGWSQIDGTLNVGGDMLVTTGILSGRGTINSDFLTVVGGLVAPGGGDAIGTLTVNSDMILASASSYFVDADRTGADKLVVAGVLALNGGSIVFNKVTNGAAPRDKQKFIVADAGLTVDGTFGSAFTFQGVLRPMLTYVDSNDADALPDQVVAEMRAGSLITVLQNQNPTAIAFASALDLLRTNSYTQLWNLYGAVDWMNGAQLAATFNTLSPKIIGETQRMQDDQSKMLMTTISDRLSLLGTGRANGMTLGVGTVSVLASNRSVGGLNAAQRLGISSGGSSGGATIPLAGGLSGFVSGGIQQARTSYGDENRANAGRRGWHGGFGLELPLGDKATFGTAIGYAEGASNANSDRSESSLRQVAAYASYSLGHGAYLGGIAAAEMASADVNRLGYDGVSTLSLTGAAHSTRYAAMAEAGWRKEIGSGLALTPRAQFGYSHYSLRGFNERGGETALLIDDVTVSRLETRFGAKLDGTTKFGAWTVRPQIQADYVKLLSGAQTDAVVRFASAPEFGFALPLTSGGSGWTEVKGGIEFGRGAFTLGLNGQATVGNAPIVDQRGALDLTLRF